MGKSELGRLKKEERAGDLFKKFPLLSTSFFFLSSLSSGRKSREGPGEGEEEREREKEEKERERHPREKNGFSGLRKSPRIKWPDGKYWNIWTA